MFLLSVRESILLIFLSIHTDLYLSGRLSTSTLVVWDSQTGVVIREFDIEGSHKIMFHGDQRTITFIGFNNIYTYDVLDGAQLWKGRSNSSFQTKVAAHWTHGDTIWFVTTFESDGEFVVNVHKLQPVGPPLVVSSFPSPLQSECFAFSPVTFHASFRIGDWVTIFDIQDSKLLLQTRVALGYTPLPGKFSPDGCFFACEQSQGEILVWQNAPTGYVPWRSLRLRFSPNGYSWSPTSMSILCWTKRGIWLLDLGNHPSYSLPDEVQPPNQYGQHLVAYSADRAYVATVLRHCGVVTVINCHTGASWQFTDTGMEIQDIRIVDNTIFVVDKHKLLGWAIEKNMEIGGAPSARRVTVDETLTINGGEKVSILSHDCLQIAFIKLDEISVYNVKTQQTIHRYMDYSIADIRFSPDGLHLWFYHSDYGYTVVGLEGAERSWGYKRVIQGGKKDGQILFNHTSPCGYHVGLHAKWVTDSSSRKLLWLPPSWRTGHWRCIRWDDNF